MTTYVRFGEDNERHVFQTDDPYYVDEYDAVREIKQIIRDAEDGSLAEEFRTHGDFEEVSEAAVHPPAPNVYEIGNGGGLYMKNNKGNMVHVSNKFDVVYDAGQIIKHNDGGVDQIIETGRDGDGLPEYTLEVMESGPNDEIHERGDRYTVTGQDIKENDSITVVDDYGGRGSY